MAFQFSDVMSRWPRPTPAMPVFNGSVIGYRAWRIREWSREWSLVGTSAFVRWVPGVNEARCVPGMLSIPSTLPRLRPHPAPAPALGCNCGITALARFSKHDEHWRRADVYGAIEAWSDETAEDAPGRFILHATGFRAQFAKVVLLAVDDDWPAAKRAAVRALAQEHGADVCQRSHLEDAAKEHGQLVPDEMLRWAGKVDGIRVTSDTTVAVDALAKRIAALDRQRSHRLAGETSVAVDGMLRSIAASRSSGMTADALARSIATQLGIDPAYLSPGP